MMRGLPLKFNLKTPKRAKIFIIKNASKKREESRTKTEVFDRMILEARKLNPKIELPQKTASNALLVLVIIKSSE